MERVCELKSPPVIGKKYLVPCLHYRGIWLPIIGDFHTDVELGVPKKHWHYDVRFFTEAKMDSLTRSRRSYSAEVALLGSVFFQREDGKPAVITERVKLCRREMPNFPLLISPEFQNFHSKYDGKKVKCGKCPHRNFPIGSLPRDKDGFVICNGHGLKIDTKTNRVVSRFEK